jgi:hypothetical protein
VQALIALGYNDKEAALALKALPADVGVNEGIKLALKGLRAIRRPLSSRLAGQANWRAPARWPSQPPNLLA